MGSTIRVLIFEPGINRGVVRTVPHELAALQALIGGHLEAVRSWIFGAGMMLVVNEDGHGLDLPYNRLGILGTFFVVRVAGNDFASLTDEDVRTARAMFEII